MAESPTPPSTVKSPTQRFPQSPSAHLRPSERFRPTSHGCELRSLLRPTRQQPVRNNIGDAFWPRLEGAHSVFNDVGNIALFLKVVELDRIGGICTCDVLTGTDIVEEDKLATRGTTLPTTAAELSDEKLGRGQTLKLRFST